MRVLGLSGSAGFQVLVSTGFGVSRYLGFQDLRFGTDVFCSAVFRAVVVSQGRVLFAFKYG